MPTRLLLDGDDLAALMHRVRAEMGPNAVVVRAERVRTGGVAGFFAKEHFELTVEVPEPRPRTPRRLTVGRPAAPTSMAGLLDAADAAEARAGHAPSDGSTPVEIEISAEVTAEESPRVSTNAVNFASLLASIDVMSGAPVPALLDSLDTPAPAAPAAPSAPLSSPSSSDFLIDSLVVSSSTAPALPAAGSSPVVPGAKFSPGFPVLLAGTGGRAIRPAPSGGDRRALLGLGVPAALLGTGSLDETLPLSDLLAQLVRPPVLLREPGSIIAVVGESSQALAVATQLAVRVRQDPRDVVLAGVMPGVVGHTRRLLSPSAATMHRARVADGEQISIVAVGVGPEAEDWPVAAELLADLGPDQAWAVVAARRKTSDLRSWLRAVGAAREFDVAAAASVHETQEPGTVLDLGLPVGWIDGLPATPVVWAAVLSERLLPGTRWD